MTFPIFPKCNLIVSISYGLGLCDAIADLRVQGARDDPAQSQSMIFGLAWTAVARPGPGNSCPARQICAGTSAQAGSLRFYKSLKLL
jgi:hypothetical protein